MYTYYTHTNCIYTLHQFSCLQCFEDPLPDYGNIVLLFEHLWSIMKPAALFIITSNSHTHALGNL